MDASAFDPFRSELLALSQAVASLEPKTIRNVDLRERFRTVFRVWITNVEPGLRTTVSNTRDLVKLSAELERLAQLTSKIKPVSEYRKRLRRAIELANGSALYLPASGDTKHPTIGPRHELFIPSIPDLPLSLVPNPIVGWRSKLETFLREHPFEKSVFIMIRYRKRNASLIKAVKNILREHDLFGVLCYIRMLTDDLYNPIACLLCCARGIAIFDQGETDQQFNPNVAY